MQNSEQNEYKDKDFNILFEELKVELLDYADKKFNYFKLSAYEKISIVFALLAFAGIVAILGVGLLFFGLFGLAFFIGELLNSFAAGFGILFAFILLILIVLLVFNKPLRHFIMNKAIIIIRKVEANEDI